MASFQEHLNQAKSNLEFLGKINTCCNTHWDWQVTTCYYVCVHFVNAHIAETANLHYRTHKQVEEAINPFNSIPIASIDEQTWVAYKSLRNLSRRSRYLISEKENDRDTGGRYTHDMHFRKAVIQLDNILLYFSKKYTISIPITELKCVDFRPVDTFVNFTKSV